MSLPVELYAIASGTVQGVAFRYKVKQIADAHGLTGYAQNLPNGSVVVVCQGPQERIDAFVEKVWKIHYPVDIEDFKTVIREPQAPFVEFAVK
ncbi:MAG: acylphosphatase [Chlamydiia bacterium]|nr:acylphosphatase [Chlamydiia bacterium]